MACRNCFGCANQLAGMLCSDCSLLVVSGVHALLSDHSGDLFDDEVVEGA